MVLLGLVLLLIPFETHPVLSQSIAGLTPIKWIGSLAVLKSLIAPNSGRPVGLFSTRHGLAFLLLIAWSFVVWAFNLNWGSVPLQTQASFLLLFVLILRTVDTVELVRYVSAILVLALAGSSLYIFKEYVVYSKVYGEEFRPWGGTFSDTNYFALSAVMVLPYAWANWRLCEGRLARIVFQAMAGLVLIAIIISLSRGALVALLGMIGSGLLLSHNRKKALLVAVAMLVGLGIALPERMWNRIQHTRVVNEGDVRGDVASTTRRWHLYGAGFRMLREHPITGVGLGGFKQLSTVYEPRLDRPGIAHSTYLELAAEQGLPALALFIVMIIGVRRDLLVVVRSEDQGSPFYVMSKALLLSQTGFYVGALFLSAWNTKVYWVSVFAAICLLSAWRAVKQDAH